MEFARIRYLEKLISKKHNGLIKVITGMRRCGKSYLLFTLFKKHLLKECGVDSSHIIEMAFDSFENKKFRNPDVLYPHIKEQITDSSMYYILLDEVQLLGEFEDVLNGLIRIENVDVYVTGSNARFLSKDVITEFRGRGDEVHMFPLSFSEFMENYNGNKYDGWNEFLMFGGIPLVVNQQTTEQKTELLKSLFKETYINDITGRHNIKNKDEFEELIDILASGIGSLTNPKKLSDTFKSKKQKKISVNTLKNYLDYLCDAFVVEKAVRYDIKGKRYIDTPHKYYFTDTGLRNARINFRQIEETHLMENVIFNELLIRGFNVDVGIVTANEKNAEKQSIRKYFEVDFVCNKASKRYYIQSALAIGDSEKLKQESNSLLKVEDSFKKIIVTKDALSPYYTDDGILIMGIYDFLEKSDSLDF